jgi:hypothetical protein
MGRTRPVAAMELPLKGTPSRLFGIPRPRAMERLELVGPPVVDATPTARPSASLGATQHGVLAAMMGAANPRAGEDYWSGGPVLEEVLPSPVLRSVSRLHP